MLDEALAAKLETLPTSPGCYLMRDRAGEIVYVGKALNLRSRVRSYFTKADSRAFVQILDQVLGDIDVILTNTEKEALLLENELIKKHHPRFNVMLRDDKNFISLRLDIKQPYPRLEVVRRIRKDGARYFGPYSSASSIRETLRIVNRHFQLRTCSDQVMSNRRRPCLQYQIKRCPGPCVYAVPHEEYRRSIEDVSLFLSGKTDDLTEQLKDRMKGASRDLRFEDAARLRDQIVAIDRSLEKQRTINIDPIDQDVFSYHREGPLLLIQILFIRGGRMSGGRHFPFKGQEFPDDELLAQFISQYYDGGAFVPREVLLPIDLPNATVVEEWLAEKKGSRVQVLLPQRGEKLKLLEMARENAEHNFHEWRSRNANDEETLLRLERRLRLTRIPRRIECYDNSHLQGTLAVGSRVTFMDGEPDKTLYRHYKVRTASGNDDFQMMYEVLTRRLSRGVAEDDLPDLIVIDGGKGQLNVARTVLREQKLVDRIDLCSLAKSRVVDDEQLFAARQGFTPDDFKVEGQARDSATPEGVAPAVPGTTEEPRRGAGKSRNRGRYKKGDIERSPERVFLPGQKNPIVLRANSAELFLLQRLRDEAHRFAISFQRRLRRNANFRSVLREIPGVGDTRQRALLRHFGSLRRIREAAVDEIAAVEGFPAKLAEEVWRFFHTTPEAKPADAAHEAEELAMADAGLESLDGEAPGEGDDPESAAMVAEIEAEVEQEQGEAPAPAATPQTNTPA
jgi:excinuclease ABC subunit C